MPLNFFVKLVAPALFIVIAQMGWANPDDFSVRAVTGTNVFKLSEAKGKFVALHFLLKTECPYCIRHTHDYARKSASDVNVVHIFLKPDTEAEIKQWSTKLGTGITNLVIYRDPDATLARSYKIPDGYHFHGQTVHFPALVLLDPKGKEVFRYVGKSNADRMPYEHFTEKLKAPAKTLPR